MTSFGEILGGLVVIFITVNGIKKLKHFVNNNHYNSKKSYNPSLWKVFQIVTFKTRSLNNFTVAVSITFIDL